VAIDFRSSDRGSDGKSSSDNLNNEGNSGSKNSDQSTKDGSNADLRPVEPSKKHVNKHQLVLISKAQAIVTLPLVQKIKHLLFYLYHFHKNSTSFLGLLGIAQIKNIRNYDDTLRV
jgi:hypothetical protein